MSSYNIKLVRCMEDFRSHAEQWRHLLKNSYSNSLFLTWEWLYTWCEVFLNSERNLSILMVYRNKELIGIAPWYLNPIRNGPFCIRQIQFIGSPEASSDYLDLIALKGKEEKVASALYAFLLNDIGSEWDTLHLKDFPANSLNMVRFLRLLESNGKYVEIGNGSYCPLVELPMDKKSFFRQISANRRQKYHRDHKILMKSRDIRHVTLGYRHGKIDLGEIKKLYEKRWEGDHDKLFLFLEKFIERTREEGIVQTDLLLESDSLVAGIIHFTFDNTIYNYLLSVDTDHMKTISIGNLFIGMCILNAINKNFKQYDFLKGEENYKFHWANHGNRLLNITYYNNNIAPLFSLSKKKIKDLGKIMLR